MKKQAQITALEKRVAELEAIIANLVKVDVQSVPKQPENPVFIPRNWDGVVWYVRQNYKGEWDVRDYKACDGDAPGFRTKESAEDWAEFNRVCLLLRAQEGWIPLSNKGFPLSGSWKNFYRGLADFDTEANRAKAIKAVGGQSVIDNAARIFMGLGK